MSVADTSLTTELKVIGNAWIFLLFLDSQFEQSRRSFSVLRDQRCLQSSRGVWKAAVFSRTITLEHSFVSHEFTCLMPGADLSVHRAGF